MAPISIPVAARLPSALRIDPTSSIVTRILGRLSRPSMLSLALDWLDDGNQALTAPFLRGRREGEEEEEEDGDDDFYPPASSLETLRQSYSDLQDRKGSKREVLDRILEGDWRHGLTMYQLAMADVQHLYDHPTSQRWTAFQIVPLKPEAGAADGEPAAAVVDKTTLVVPRFHPSSFLRNLQSQILPDIKVHYNFDRHKHLPMLLLRIFILDSPYNTARAVAGASGSPSSGLAGVEASRTVYVAFPDASPFVYLSSAQTVEPSSGPGGTAGGSVPSGRDIRSLRSLVVEAIPKALSRPRERYALKPTSMTTRSLSELLQRRGGGRTNTAGGGWAIYADEKTIESPLSTVLPTPPLSEADEDKNGKYDGDDKESKSAEGDAVSKKRRSLQTPAEEREQRLAKRRKRVAAARFGPTAKIDDGQGIERLDIVMQDPFPGDVPPEDDAAAARAESGQKARGSRLSHVGAVLAREVEERDHEDAAGAGDDQARPAGNVWCPRVAFTFHGSHVFAGIRQLVEAGVIDGERMPGWMTGEEGVTVGAVRDGRIRGHKGSGMP